MKNTSLCAVVCAAALAAGGCHDNTQPLPGPHSAPIASTPSPRDKVVVYVINPKATGDQDPLMPRTVALRHPDSPARDAINALLQADDSPVPAGTSLRGITLDSGLATLDFSRTPVNETGGEGHQSDALTALSRTLGQFPEIRQYQIMVHGRIVKTFGEFTTDGPIDVVRPDAVQQAKGATP